MAFFNSFYLVCHCSKNRQNKNSHKIMCSTFYSPVEFNGVGGAILDTFNRFENSADKVESVGCGVVVLLLLNRLIVCGVVDATVELPFDGIRNLLLGAGTIFDPCTRFTCLIIPSGAII